jgi:hypothetical protein
MLAAQRSVLICHRLHGTTNVGALARAAKAPAGPRDGCSSVGLAALNPPTRNARNDCLADGSRSDRGESFAFNKQPFEESGDVPLPNCVNASLNGDAVSTGADLVGSLAE